MSEALWPAIVRHLETLLVPTDPSLESNLTSSLAAGLPPIQVSTLQGKFLHLLSAPIGAKRILEIGTKGHDGQAIIRVL
jgi:predicted O-methyltransferase YrrM